MTGGSNWNWGFWAATAGSHTVLVVINDSYNSLFKLLYVPPAPLSSLTAVGGDGQISLAWAAVSGATSYNLYRSTTAGGEGSVPYKTGLLTTSCADIPVPGGTTYYYTFTAVGAQGESAQSNEASATAQSFGAGRARFYPRVGFEGRMLGGKFQGSNDGTSYTDLATVTTTPSANQYTQQALSADPKLFRYLRYLSPSGGYCDIAELEFYSGSSTTTLTGTIFGSPGTWGNDCSRVFDGTPGTFFDAPAADGAYVGLRQSALSPFTLTAVPSASQISLSWTGVAGASGYNVRRGTVSGGPYTVIAPGCSGTSYTDTNVIGGATYYYIVTALSSGGESAFSNEAIAKIGGVLAPYGGSPVSVAASGTTTIEAENYDLGGQGIAFNDIDNGNQSGYRSDNIGVASDGNASNGFTVGWAQGGEWDGYTLNVAAAGSYAMTARVACPSAGGMFHVEFGPVGQVGGAGVVQSQEITVPNTGSWSNFQAVLLPVVRLPAGPLWMRLVLDYGGSGRYVANFDAFSLTPAGPAAPTNLTAMAGSGQIILSWAISPGAATYNLYRSTTPGGEGATPYKTGLTGTSYTDANVTPGTTYYYTVAAVSAGGESARSNEASAAAQPVTSPDFALRVNPSLNVPSGKTGTLAVNVVAINNFIGTVAFSVSDLPAGVTAAFSPTTVAGSGGSTLTLTTDPTLAMPGSTTVTVTGTASPSGPAHSQTLTLTITGAGGNLASGSVRLTDIYLPKTLRIEWLPQSYQYNSYVVTRSGGGASSGTTTGNTFWNDAFAFVFQTPYTYHVVDNWTADRYWDSTNQVWIYPSGQVDLGSLTVTPMQTLVTENQVVDARYDPRYSAWIFVNHKFGTTTYRGGLFAGYNADNSQVGHSYLKFLLPPPASGQTVLPVASVNAWFTRNYDLTGSPNPDSVGVACQSVPSYWDAAGITWANAPAFSPSQTAQLVSGTSQTAPWVHWKVGVDVAGILNAGGGPYSVALSGTQEPAVGGAGPAGGATSGWAYFAKKEYAGGQPATLLYALSGAGVSAHVARPASQVGAKKTSQVGAKKERSAPAQKKP